MHPATKSEIRQRPSKGKSKFERLAKQNAEDEEARAAKKAYVECASGVHKDSYGMYFQGELLKTGIGYVALSIMTIGRNRHRALDCRAAVAKAFEIPPECIFVLLNWDYKHPSHFDQFNDDIQGRVAFYDSLAKKVLPKLESTES